MYTFYDEEIDKLPDPFNEIQNVYKFVLEPYGDTLNRLRGLGTSQDKFRFGRNRIEVTSEEFVFGDFPLENI